MGNTLDLSTLVTENATLTGNAGTTMAYYTTLSNAQNETSAIGSSVVTVSAATSYWVRKNVSWGSGPMIECEDIKEITVGLFAAVTAGMTNNGPLTCSTTSVTLTGTGGATYAYSGGSATVSVPGIYTVTATSADGCTATATTEVLQNLTAPTAGLTNDGPLTCITPTVTLTATGGVSYAYSGGSASVTTAGTYTVTATAANGCTATASTTVTMGRAHYGFYYRFAYFLCGQ